MLVQVYLPETETIEEKRITSDFIVESDIDAGATKIALYEGYYNANIAMAQAAIAEGKGDKFDLGMSVTSMQAANEYIARMYKDECEKI